MTPKNICTVAKKLCHEKILKERITSFILFISLINHTTAKHEKTKNIFIGEKYYE